MTSKRAIGFIAALILTLGLIGAAFARSGGAADPVSAAAPTDAATTVGDGRPTGTVPTTTAAADTDPTSTTPDATAADTTVDDPADGHPAVHEVLTGSHGTPPPAGPGDLIGDLGDDRPVPAGLDLVAPPKQPGKPNALGGPGALADAPSCAHQCITSGKAFPRGFGAELVVKTSVPTSMFVSVVADLDDDGDYEDAHYFWSESDGKEHHATFDHLAPGTTYHAMAAATDADGHTAYAWGTFTTLSQRSVFVELGDLTVDGGPGKIVKTSWLLGLDGPLTDVTPGQQGILLYHDLPRTVGVDFWVVRAWHDEICEVWLPQAAYPQGHDGASCLAWNSTSVDVDLDTIPAGQAHWTSTTVSLNLQPPSGEGNALPPGYGDPYWFAFSVPVTLHVMYS